MGNVTENKTRGISGKEVEMQLVAHEQESYFQIRHQDAMRPFFMSMVSDANHWMFIASNGGLTAGRKNPEYALFPYYTEDKIIESAGLSGSKTIFQVRENGTCHTWEPFSDRCAEKHSFSRNLYKHIYGHKIMFEEVHHDLGLVFRYQWNSGKEFGFIRKASLINTSGKDYQITLLDGIQNILPCGVPSDLQRSSSNLVDAYKRSELDPVSGIGIFALSAIIVDRPEPSESLKANIAWSLGLDQPMHLLSSLQLDHFRRHQPIVQERDVKGEKGAYFVSADIKLEAKSEKKWTIVANVNQSQAQIINLSQSIRDVPQTERQIQADIDSGTQNLVQLVAGADGLQFTASKLNDARHFSNVLYNIMRGGTFDDHYRIEKADFIRYLDTLNKKVLSGNQEVISQLDDTFSLFDLQSHLAGSHDANYIRLATEYLPLKFSRRHGDPSRPWNYFTINTLNETDGSKILDYEGNWRDLFQNWEALAVSYPAFIEGMIFKFLNASTFDGYNPYRVTRNGFDWETIEADNPWSYIGYWGDHQIIYLLKFLEILDRHQPGKLQTYFDKECFVYAAVPYIIKPYDDILKNPKSTISFDQQWDQAIRKKQRVLGTDGALLTDVNQEIYHVNFLEKILAAVLAKVSNFVPGAGIWLNTQRPEWNDANNALVGNGASMVTLYHLRRFMKFFESLLADTRLDQIKLSGELVECYHSIRETLQDFRPMLANGMGDKDRRAMMERLGQAASEYRQHIYKQGFWGKKRSVSLDGIRAFTSVCLDFTEHSIRANERSDKLYHAYNLIAVSPSGISHTTLQEMLEGQVAALSSGCLNAGQAVEVLDALKNSALYRADQNSYILYPNKRLPGFLEKNIIPAADAASSALIRRLIEKQHHAIVEKDVLGNLHFNSDFKNAADLEKALNELPAAYGDLLEKEKVLLLELFEKVFNHKAFTGRSGTFFAYEGLGSIYWHMVSKLRLSVQECYLKARQENADPGIVERLKAHYHDVEAGIGVQKPPQLYGAFPTDPYSHTPQHRGAQQPGMTGQVKEDILARFGELGVFVRGGQIHFDPTLLKQNAFAPNAHTIEYLNTRNKTVSLPLPAGSLCFTYCQVPVIYKLADREELEVFYADGSVQTDDALLMDRDPSELVFRRSDKIERIEVSLNRTRFQNIQTKDAPSA